MSAVTDCIFLIFLTKNLVPFTLFPKGLFRNSRNCILCVSAVDLLGFACSMTLTNDRKKIIYVGLCFCGYYYGHGVTCCNIVLFCIFSFVRFHSCALLSLVPTCSLFQVV